MDTELLLNSVEEAQILGIFKNICDNYMKPYLKNSLRNILAVSTNQSDTIKNIVNHKYNLKISEQEANRLLDLVKAFLCKSNYRKAISKDLKEKLLVEQNYECSFCKHPIDISAHADHIVPFKYVGDCLNNNLQMLCSDCNKKKNDSLDYQIKFLLKLV